jgi:hypothetical protein
MARTGDGTPDGYPAAVALLRAVYDMIDAVKTWETSIGLDGSAQFQQVCAALDVAYGSQRNGRPALGSAGRWTLGASQRMSLAAEDAERWAAGSDHG